MKHRTPQERQAYRDGLRAGICLYSRWEGNVRYVGAGYRTLADALPG